MSDLNSTEKDVFDFISSTDTPDRKLKLSDIKNSLQCRYTELVEALNSLIEKGIIAKLEDENGNSFFSKLNTTSEMNTLHADDLGTPDESAPFSQPEANNQQLNNEVADKLAIAIKNGSVDFDEIIAALDIDTQDPISAAVFNSTIEDMEKKGFLKKKRIEFDETASPVTILEGSEALLEYAETLESPDIKTSPEIEQSYLPSHSESEISMPVDTMQTDEVIDPIVPKTDSNEQEDTLAVVGESAAQLNDIKETPMIAHDRADDSKEMDYSSDKTSTFNGTPLTVLDMIVANYMQGSLDETISKGAIIKKFESNYAKIDIENTISKLENIKIIEAMPGRGRKRYTYPDKTVKFNTSNIANATLSPIKRSEDEQAASIKPKNDIEVKSSSEYPSSHKVSISSQAPSQTPSQRAISSSDVELNSLMQNTEDKLKAILTNEAGFVDLINYITTLQEEVTAWRRGFSAMQNIMKSQ